MRNQDTTEKTGSQSDGNQKAIANFGQEEKTYLIKKECIDVSYILTFPCLLQARLDSKDGQAASRFLSLWWWIRLVVRALSCNKGTMWIKVSIMENLLTGWCWVRRKRQRG